MNLIIITYKLHQRYLKMFVTASIQFLICQIRNNVLYKRIIDTKKKLILKHNILQKIILFCRNINSNKLNIKLHPVSLASAVTFSRNI